MKRKTRDSELGERMLHLGPTRKIPVFKKKPGCGEEERVHPGFGLLAGKAGVLSDQ
jgi:hypothetical protein